MEPTSWWMVAKFFSETTEPFEEKVIGKTDDR